MFDWSSIDIHFTEASENQLRFAPLIDYSLITVKGPDAEKFLQGQCTCDFTLLHSFSAILGAHCTAKGRMIASFVAAQMGENAIGLRVHNSVCPQLLASLKKYAVFSKVEILQSDQFALLGIIQAESAKDTILNINLKHSVHLNENNIQEMWVAKDTLKEHWKDLQNTFSVVEQSRWQLENIRRGLGEVRIETLEFLLPQEINFQLVHGVSFKKGCYTGQEIVARMHYKGQLKKHMYRAECETDSPPASGNPIYVDDQETKCGTVIFSSKVNDKKCELLVLASDTCRENDSVTLGDESRSIIQWLPLPYAIS
ncbi:folate-binding protein [Teredinibacter sp. KSP-S5-2]|uniref:CAF17-like 4Fe-4S cluster assembly/insertion protein YgfZ n=1 Tax=Teredinibacter sp. KSP-S5-2 TaxID=3034506 RepID=UPI0029344954|nr:folate-binding protein [Teredinibacter sp. KSP-S5-2]WNO08028.1 folate-binding protein [Teredinibacter sp. KSP-S5-2]